MEAFRERIAANCTGRAMFASDNSGFERQFVDRYFLHFVGENPFGFSSANLARFTRECGRAPSSTSSTYAKLPTPIIP